MIAKNQQKNVSPTLHSHMGNDTSVKFSACHVDVKSTGGLQDEQMAAIVSSPSYFHVVWIPFQLFDCINKSEPEVNWGVVIPGWLIMLAGLHSRFFIGLLLEPQWKVNVISGSSVLFFSWFVSVGRFCSTSELPGGNLQQKVSKNDSDRMQIPQNVFPSPALCSERRMFHFLCTMLWDPSCWHDTRHSTLVWLLIIYVWWVKGICT